MSASLDRHVRIVQNSMTANRFGLVKPKTAKTGIVSKCTHCGISISKGQLYRSARYAYTSIMDAIHEDCFQHKYGQFARPGS